MKVQLASSFLFEKFPRTSIMLAYGCPILSNGKCFHCFHRIVFTTSDESYGWNQATVTVPTKTFFNATSADNYSSAATSEKNRQHLASQWRLDCNHDDVDMMWRY